MRVRVNHKGVVLERTEGSIAPNPNQLKAICELLLKEGRDNDGWKKDIAGNRAKKSRV